jgi:NAD(P)-dependent dehydrogenase (short-subunit alcohol dehydrogenase family)
LSPDVSKLMADGGRIVNVSTGLARFTQPGYAAYASAKGAVEVMTRYLALELGSRQIAVNVIARERSRPTSRAAWCATTRT